METKPQIKKVLVIVGPTSSGKTSMAINLAKRFNAEIISADSRQIYKYMDLGTGKVPVNSSFEVIPSNNFWEINGIKVWGYDLTSPGQYFSAYDFATFALQKIEEIHAQEKNVIIVGGTGFYIDVLSGKSTVHKSQPNPQLRESLEKLTLTELQEKLKETNIEIYKKIDVKNPRRLIRALEKDLSPVKSKDLNLTPPNLNFVYLGLEAPRETLYKNADYWVENIWEEGFIEETRKLLSMGYEETPQLKGLAYKSAVSFIKGEISESEAIQKTKYDIHAYIRRQQTWFKRNQEIEWLDITQENFRQNASDIVKSKLEWIETS